MARTLYAGRGADLAISRFVVGGGRTLLGTPADALGLPAAVTLTVWDETKTIQYDDLLAEDEVTPITEVVVPAGEVQIPAFYGPDGVATDLWLLSPQGVWVRVDVGLVGPAGTAGLVWRGDWAAATAYAVNDAVFYAGSSYRRLVAGTTATAPDMDAVNWTLVAEKGTDGTGTGTVNSVNGQSPDGAGAVTVPASAVGSTAVGGLAATNVQAALAELDAEKQPLDTDLSAIAALPSAANKVPYATGPGTWSLADLTAFARTLLDDADAATARATVGAASATQGGAEVYAAAPATSGTITLDVSAANIYTLTPTGNFTLAFTGWPTGKAGTVTVLLTSGATAYTPTYPAASDWGETTPKTTLPASKTVVLNFLKLDSAATIHTRAA